MMQYTGNHLPGKDMVPGTLCAKHPNSLSGKRRQSPLFEVALGLGETIAGPFLPTRARCPTGIRWRNFRWQSPYNLTGIPRQVFWGEWDTPGPTERLAVENSRFAAILRDKATLRNKMRIGDRD